MKTNNISIGFSDGGSFSDTINGIVIKLIGMTPVNLGLTMEEGGKISITIEELGDHFKWDISKLKTVRNLLNPEEWSALMAIAKTKKQKKKGKKKSSRDSDGNYVIVYDRPWHGSWGGHGGHHGGSGSGPTGGGSGSGSSGSTGGGTGPIVPVVKRGTKFQNGQLFETNKQTPLDDENPTKQSYARYKDLDDRLDVVGNYVDIADTGNYAIVTKITSEKVMPIIKLAKLDWFFNTGDVIDIKTKEEALEHLIISRGTSKEEVLEELPYMIAEMGRHTNGVTTESMSGINYAPEWRRDKIGETRYHIGNDPDKQGSKYISVRVDPQVLPGSRDSRNSAPSSFNYYDRFYINPKNGNLIDEELGEIYPEFEFTAPKTKINYPKKKK